ncbi:DUF3040 domain-containing protein [Streptomyces termitum]|uniref:DUF3040 domain-containing protein n=1 Tax=Streptomyces termitum TaxID=67368 RepID=A0A918T3Y7_9ACTN|nr:DUF3040 domain-containing protein [Streptomyces termitum]GHA88665.1 hypothetical protein GCM10010305_35390 [Streptomyces termitum]
MYGTEEERLGAIEDRLRRDDPGFVRALAAGRPRRPREERPVRAWALLAAAFALLACGVVLPHGLLIAAGLVLAGLAADRFPPP